MKPTLALRIASIVMLILAAGHTAGGLSCWSPAGETEVLRAMRSFRLDAMGASRTYLDFYLGFGFTISVYVLMQAVVFWQLASIAKSDAYRIRPLIGTFLLASIASAVLARRFLFVVPVIFSCVVAVCLALAFHGAGKHKGV